ncbi:hypothetical protein G3A39_38435 [Paraburkholderia aspalathi]|nr:hypothetical protein [Paraburkholderia aspalathi]
MKKTEIFTLPLKMLQKLLMMIAKLIDAILRMLFGASAPSLASRIPQLKTTPEELVDALQTTQADLYERAHILASDVGRSIHMYASAREPLARAAIDLSGLPTEQQDWLLSLSDADLERLAMAGENACDRAAVGKKCGVVGLSKPNERPEILAMPSDAKTLSERVKRHNIIRKAHGEFTAA